MTTALHVVLFGTYDEANHPRVRVLREGLTTLGHRVEVVNVALRLDTAGRVELAKQPWRAPLAAVRLLATWASLLFRSRKVHRPDVVLVGYLGHFDVHLARCRWPQAHLVVDHMISLADTVRDRGVDGKTLVVKALDLVDRAAVRQADTVVVDTAEHLDSLRPERKSKAVIVPVGAPQAWLEVGAARDLDVARATQPLRIVFFGLYTPLQGARTIGDAIRLLGAHGISWTMIGTGQDRAATEEAAGNVPVTWLDWVEGDDLPSVVAEHDVCLGIFGTGPKALRVTPNKVYQGAAAGCAIVTSDTPPQRRALGDGALYVTPGDANGLAEVLAQLVDDQALLRQHQQKAQTIARTRFSPAAVVDSLAARLSAAHYT